MFLFIIPMFPPIVVMYTIPLMIAIFPIGAFMSLNMFPSYVVIYLIVYIVLFIVVVYLITHMRVSIDKLSLFVIVMYLIVNAMILPVKTITLDVEASDIYFVKEIERYYNTQIESNDGVHFSRRDCESL